MKRYRINTPHVVSEVFADEEAAVINLKTGNYYSINKTGAEIWSLIETGASLGGITDFICNNFNGDNDSHGTEIGQFIEKLVAEDLIVADEKQSTDDSMIAKGASGDRKKYEPPIIECYADMQELLLLDPIHEVEETNWLVNRNP